MSSAFGAYARPWHLSLTDTKTTPYMQNGRKKPRSQEAIVSLRTLSNASFPFLFFSFSFGPLVWPSAKPRNFFAKFLWGFPSFPWWHWLTIDILPWLDLLTITPVQVSIQLNPAIPHWFMITISPWHDPLIIKPAQVSIQLNPAIVLWLTINIPPWLDLLTTAPAHVSTVKLC